MFTERKKEKKTFPFNCFFFFFAKSRLLLGFPGGSVVKNLTANAGDTGDMGSIPTSGRSSGEGNGNLLQYSCLENPMDRGAWWATIHGVRMSQTRLSDLPTTMLSSTMLSF